MMVKRVFVVSLLLAAVTVAAIPRRAAQQVKTGTNQGVIGVKIAVPEFPVSGSDAKTAALAAAFNKTLWDDLDYSGGVTLVSRSYYPIGKFSSPGDIKPEA